MATTSWTLVRTIAPTLRPVSLEQVKQSLRLNIADDSHDADLVRMIDAATEQWEQDSDGGVMQQTFLYSADAFPCNNASIKLPNHPTGDIDSITYMDEDGAEQTLDDSIYGVDAGRREVYLFYGESWPTTASHQLAVNVTYKVGYATVDQVPREIQQAIILQAGKWFADPMMESPEAFAHDEAYERLARRNLRTSYP